jgi:hypothetical protein
MINLGIHNVYKYDEKWKEYGLYTMDTKYQIKRIDPKRQFPTYFKNLYDFLNIDTTHFIKNKTLWENKCRKLNITEENYFEECKKYHDLPNIP